MSLVWPSNSAIVLPDATSHICVAPQNRDCLCTRDVPNSRGMITSRTQRSDNARSIGIERSARNAMGVFGKDGEQGTGFAISDARIP